MNENARPVGWVESRRQSVQRYNFTTFDSEISADIAAAYDEALIYAHHPVGWFALSGGHGTGKSHLGYAIAQVIGADLDEWCGPVCDMMDRLSMHSDHYWERLNFFKTRPFLLLDDFTLVEQTPWVTEKLFQIIDYRWFHRLYTVITFTGNLRNVHPGIVSRLQDVTLTRVVYLGGVDYRRIPLSNPPVRRRPSAIADLTKSVGDTDEHTS